MLPCSLLSDPLGEGVGEKALAPLSISNFPREKKNLQLLEVDTTIKNTQNTQIVLVLQHRTMCNIFIKIEHFNPSSFTLLGAQPVRLSSAWGEGRTWILEASSSPGSPRGLGSASWAASCSIAPTEHSEGPS